MFSLLAGAYTNYIASPELNVLVVGASGVGKTTLLERLKVTQIASNQKVTTVQPQTLPRTGANDPEQQHDSDSESRDLVEVPVKALNSSRRRASFLCPAPKKYQQEDSDDDGDEDDEDESTRALIQHKMPTLTKPERRNSSTGTMESIDLQKQNQTEAAPDHGGAPCTCTDYDLKPGAKMLPARRIRPTIGTNVAKVTTIGGCKLTVYDVGGRLRDLWERYYNDADAVIFVHQVLDLHDDQDTHTTDDDDDDDDASTDSNDSDKKLPVTEEEQNRLLEMVRANIPDDVPFLVLGHVHTATLPTHCRVDRPFSLSRLLPHYHNPTQVYYYANARTGQGVRAALEWLVAVARRQQPLRRRQHELLQQQWTTDFGAAK